MVMLPRLAFACLALLLFCTARASAETPPPATLSPADAYEQGRAALRAGRYEESAALLEQAASAAAANADYQMWLGSAYAQLARRGGVIKQLGYARKCKAAFERAVQIAPDDLEARSRLFEFYRQAPTIAGGGQTLARETAEELKRRDLFRGEMALAALAIDEQQWDKAEGHLLAAAAEKPDALRPRLSLAQVMLSRGKVEQAFDVLEKLSAEKPDDRSVLFQIGRAAALSGQRLERGEAALNQYLKPPFPMDEELPPPAAAHWRLGNLAEKRGDSQAARTHYEEALSLDPDLKQARQALKNLK